MTPDTVFMLASVSKTVTCAGVMSVVEDGDLDLDTDVNDYLPFEVRIPAAPEEPITTRMLLIHTSAIRDRLSVWGTPYSRDSLYFHGDSPIELGEFLRSYLVPGESEYREEANFYKRRAEHTHTRTLPWRSPRTLPKSSPTATSTSYASSASWSRSGWTSRGSG